jgi:hypothetical protein
MFLILVTIRATKAKAGKGGRSRDEDTHSKSLGFPAVSPGRKKNLLQLTFSK